MYNNYYYLCGGVVVVVGEGVEGGRGRRR